MTAPDGPDDDGAAELVEVVIEGDNYGAGEPATAMMPAAAARHWAVDAWRERP